MSNPRPFRFGLQCLTAESAAAFAAGAHQAEDLGYSTLFIPDHFVDHPLAPIPAMAAAAAHTTTSAGTKGRAAVASQPAQRLDGGNGWINGPKLRNENAGWLLVHLRPSFFEIYCEHLT